MIYFMDNLIKPLIKKMFPKLIKKSVKDSPYYEVYCTFRELMSDLLYDGDCLVLKCGCMACEKIVNDDYGTLELIRETNILLVHLYDSCVFFTAPDRINFNDIYWSFIHLLYILQYNYNVLISSLKNQLSIEKSEEYLDMIHELSGNILYSKLKIDYVRTLLVDARTKYLNS